MKNLNNDTLLYDLPICYHSGQLFAYRIRKWLAIVRATKTIAFRSFDRKEVVEYLVKTSVDRSMFLARDL